MNWQKIIRSGSNATLNQLYVTNSVTASIFSGSFVGNGSGLSGIVVDSASYALTASYYVGQNNATFTQSTPDILWTFNHNLNTNFPVITVYNSASRVIIPKDIYPLSVNATIITFDSSQSGYAAATNGSILPVTPIITASLSYTASYLIDGPKYIASTSSFDFGYSGSYESDIATLIVSSSNVTNDNFRNFSYIPLSSSHHDVDDFAIEGIDIKVQRINTNNTIELVANSHYGTWGIYNFKYIITYI